MRQMAGATTLGNVVTAVNVRSEEASVVAELKAGSEQAYEWLIASYHQPIYNLVYRILRDPTDAADTTQEVFIKVFRGIKSFHGDASLKTWMYRIAVREASNQRRWWFRHKARETSIEPAENNENPNAIGLKDVLVDSHDNPFESCAHEEVRARVEAELKNVPEPYRTAVVLRDIEELSYEEIAEVLQVSLGTVKSRLMRGREALRQRLEKYAGQVAAELGLEHSAAKGAKRVAVRKLKAVEPATTSEPAASERQQAGSGEVEVTL
jgi:RNA polymerase sigma-70 factor, ECF subfamily